MVPPKWTFNWSFNSPFWKGLQDILSQTGLGFQLPSLPGKSCQIIFLKGSLLTSACRGEAEGEDGTSVFKLSSVICHLVFKADIRHPTSEIDYSRGRHGKG